MVSIFAAEFARFLQSEKRFMNQVRRLERRILELASPLTRGDSAGVVVNQRPQLVGRAWISILKIGKEESNFSGG